MNERIKELAEQSGWMMGDEEDGAGSVHNYDKNHYDQQAALNKALKGDKSEDWKRHAGKMRLADGVKVDIGGRTISGGMYKLKQSWTDPEGSWGVYTWMEADQHLGDIKKDTLGDLVAKNKAVGNTP